MDMSSRLLPKYIATASRQLDITCMSYSDDWVFRLTKDGKVRFVNGFYFDLNTSAASANASDKIAASTLLQNAEVPVIEHIFIDPRHVHYPCVVKPLRGSGGKEVTLLRQPQDFLTWQAAHPDALWNYAVSPLVPIQSEVRIILLDNVPLLTYRKIAGDVTPGALPFHNLSKGASAEVIQPPDIPDLVGVAKHAVATLGLRLAAVDIAETPQGPRVMEVNDSIAMEHFGRISPTYRQLAQDVHTTIVRAMFAG